MPGTDLELRPGTVLVPDRSFPRAYTLWVGGTEQSYVDLDDPRHLEFDYVQRLADLVDVIAEPGQRLRAVHVGGAAMTLPRYVSVTRPHSAQVVIEPDTELTGWVREHLPLPPRSGIKVRGTDGLSGVPALPDSSADLVVLDAFVGARVPAELTTTEFFADCARVLAPSGVLALNLTESGPFPYGRRVAAGLAASFGRLAWCAEPATLKGRRFGNVVLVASNGPLPLASLAQRAGSGPYPYRVLHGARIDQLVAGARPFTRQDAEHSPDPPRDIWLRP